MVGSLPREQYPGGLHSIYSSGRRVWSHPPVHWSLGPPSVSMSPRLGSPMKKSDFHRSNRTPIQCMQAIDLYVKTTKRAMLTLSF